MPGNTLLRQWLMLQRIPAHPLRRSTGEIAQYLHHEGYTVSKRTVERDLEMLSLIFQFTNDQESRTNYWYFPREHRVVSLPGMDSAGALALLLARDHVQPLIPPTTLDLLKPYFSRADEVMREAVPRSLADWRRRVLVMTRGPVLQAPKVNGKVQAAVYDAVLNRHKLEITYRSRRERSDSKGQPVNESREMLLHPLGLVFREGLVYLVATAWDYPDVRYYALHRFSQATCTDQRAKVPEAFDLNEYAQKAFHLPLSPSTFKLKMRMEKAAAFHLAERPLSADQEHLPSDDGHVEIRATVNDTAELRWWLLGFGRQVEVLAPVALRRELAAHARDMAARYGDA